MLPHFLHVHVPFCVRRCSYCDFAVDAVRDPPVQAWLDAVGRELELTARADGWTEPLQLQTIYVGGGTPSLLGAGALAGFAQRLARHARWDGDAVEWTAEANPESFTADLARDWRAAGVNRVSLGAQTFHEPALRWMGRLHGPDGPERAMRAARSAGIRRVSIDLIFGLPERLGRDWRADLDRALALEPEHVSLYGLTAEAATPLGRWVKEGREVMAGEERYEEEYLLAAEVLRAAGYEHYEVSNFARPGEASRHNVAYWTGAAYLGLGPGAHSFLPPQRRWNVREWPLYRARLAVGELARGGAETIGPEEARLEGVWLGLRTGAGVARAAMNEGQRALARGWEAQGWAERGGKRLRLTAPGWLLIDRLAVELTTAAGNPAVAPGYEG